MLWKSTSEDFLSQWTFCQLAATRRCIHSKTSQHEITSNNMTKCLVCYSLVLSSVLIYQPLKVWGSVPGPRASRLVTMGIARTSETLITQRHSFYHFNPSRPHIQYQLLSSYSIHLNSLCVSKRCLTRERRTPPVKLWSYFNIDTDSCGLACKQQFMWTQ